VWMRLVRREKRLGVKDTRSKVFHMIILVTVVAGTLVTMVAKAQILDGNDRQTITSDKYGTPNRHVRDGPIF
jgi:hypothetical protein